MLKMILNKIDPVLSQRYKEITGDSKDLFEEIMKDSIEQHFNTDIMSVNVEDAVKYINEKLKREIDAFS